MTLQGLLTFIGLLLASYSAIRQPYRDFVGIFVRPWILLSWLTPAFIALLWPQGMRIAGFEPCPDTLALLETIGFLLPLGCLLHCVVAFRRGALTRRRTRYLHQACVLPKARTVMRESD